MSLMEAVLTLRPELDEKALRRAADQAASRAGKDMDRTLAAQSGRTGKEVGDRLGDGLESGIAQGAADGAKRMRQSIETEAEKAYQATTQKLNSWGNKMTMGFTLPALLVGRKVRDATADLADARGAVEQTFGDAAKVIHDFAQGVGQDVDHFYGYSQRAIYRTAAVLKPYVDSFADTTEAANMAVDALKRAADMSAYFGGTTDQALEAIQSGLMNQPEPLRRYGVRLSAAGLVARAVSEGIVDSSTEMESAALKVEDAQRKATLAVKEHGEGSLEARKALNDLEKAEDALNRVSEGRGVVLTEQQKAEAAWAEIMAQSQFVAGQYTREVDGLSGSMKENRAAMERAAEAAGDAAAGPMTTFYQTVEKMFSWASKLPEPVLEFATYAIAIGATVGPILKAAAALRQLAAANALVAMSKGGGLGVPGVAGKVGAAGKGASGLLRGLGGAAGVAGAGIAGYSIGSAVGNSDWWQDNVVGGLADLFGIGEDADMSPASIERDAARKAGMTVAEYRAAIAPSRSGGGRTSAATAASGPGSSHPTDNTELAQLLRAIESHLARGLAVDVTVDGSHVTTARALNRQSRDTARTRYGIPR